MNSSSLKATGRLLAGFERDYSVFERRHQGMTHIKAAEHLGLSANRSMQMTDKVSRRLGLYNQSLALDTIDRMIAERPTLIVWCDSADSHNVLLCSVLDRAAVSDFVHFGAVNQWRRDQYILTYDMPWPLRKQHVAREAIDYLQSLLEDR